jgi:hypothetical protein
MLRKTLLFAILFVAVFAVIAASAASAHAAEVPAPPGLLSSDGPACQADPAAKALAVIGLQPVLKGHDPATCGRCLNCSSTNVCFGKLIGDLCSGTGGTCQAFDGCALYNCCRCANIGG